LFGARAWASVEACLHGYKTQYFDGSVFFLVKTTYIANIMEIGTEPSLSSLPAPTSQTKKRNRSPSLKALQGEAQSLQSPKQTLAAGSYRFSSCQGVQEEATSPDSSLYGSAPPALPKLKKQRATVIRVPTFKPTLLAKGPEPNTVEVNEKLNLQLPFSSLLPTAIVSTFYSQPDCTGQLSNYQSFAAIISPNVGSTSSNAVVILTPVAMGSDSCSEDGDCSQHSQSFDDSVDVCSFVLTQETKDTMQFQTEVSNAAEQDFSHLDFLPQSAPAVLALSVAVNSNSTAQQEEEATTTQPTFQPFEASDREELRELTGQKGKERLEEDEQETDQTNEEEDGQEGDESKDERLHAPQGELASTEYADSDNEDEEWDAVVSLRQTEAATMAASNYLEYQPAFNAAMRLVLYDWMMEVCAEFGLKRESFHLAINYTDRFLSVMPKVAKSRLQLVGTTALYIGTKLEETNPPSLSHLIRATDNAYTANQVYQMEQLILSKLGWHLLAVTPVHCLSALCTCLGKDLPDSLPASSSSSSSDEEEEASCNSNPSAPLVMPYSGDFTSVRAVHQRFFERCLRLVDVACLDIRSLSFRPSMIACTAMILCGQNVQLNLQQLGYSLEELKPCIDWMGRYVNFPTGGRLGPAEGSDPLAGQEHFPEVLEWMRELISSPPST
jgi:hypothetical protein